MYNETIPTDNPEITVKTLMRFFKNNVSGICQEIQVTKIIRIKEPLSTIYFNLLIVSTFL